MTAVQPWPLSFLNADWLAGADKISVTGLSKTVIFAYIYIYIVQITALWDR